MDAEVLAREIENNRSDLQDYLRRLLGTTDAAEDLVQTTALRALSAIQSAPASPGEVRPWLFRIATNLSIDEIRRRGRWNPEALFRSRERAEGNPEFVSLSASLRGSPEMTLIAREHLAACFACTLRNLSPERAAALLLREIYGFSAEEIGAILEVRWTQVKNWLQEARSTMESHYQDRCALIRKDGICYQCSELAEFFNGAGENPLAGVPDSFEARLRIVKELRGRPENHWHRRLFAIFDEM